MTNFEGIYQTLGSAYDHMNCVQEPEDMIHRFISRWLNMRNSLDNVSNEQAMTFKFRARKTMCELAGNESCQRLGGRQRVCASWQEKLDQPGQLLAQPKSLVQGR